MCVGYRCCSCSGLRGVSSVLHPSPTRWTSRRGLRLGCGPSPPSHRGPRARPPGRERGEARRRLAPHRPRAPRRPLGGALGPVRRFAGPTQVGSGRGAGRPPVRAPGRRSTGEAPARRPRPTRARLPRGRADTSVPDPRRWRRARLFESPGSRRPPRASEVRRGKQGTRRVCPRAQGALGPGPASSPGPWLRRSSRRDRARRHAPSPVPPSPLGRGRGAG